MARQWVTHFYPLLMLLLSYFQIKAKKGPVDPVGRWGQEQIVQQRGRSRAGRHCEGDYQAGAVWKGGKRGWKGGNQGEKRGKEGGWGRGEMRENYRGLSRAPRGGRRDQHAIWQVSWSDYKMENSNWRQDLQIDTAFRFLHTFALRVTTVSSRLKVLIV